jgi:hypothetical protein
MTVLTLDLLPGRRKKTKIAVRICASLKVASMLKAYSELEFEPSAMATKIVGGAPT